MRTPSFFTRMPSLGIRMNLAILVLGCILPIASISAFLIFSFYEHEQAQLIANAVSRARAMISAVDRSFGDTQASLLALGTSHRLATGDLIGFQERATEVLHDMRAQSIMSVDVNGKLILSTRIPFGDPLPGPDLHRERPLKHILESGEPGVTDLYKGLIAGRLIFTIAVPIRRNDVVVSALGASVAPEQLSEVLSNQKLPPSWIASVTDSSGSIVVRTRNNDRYLGTKLSQGLLQRLKTSDEGSFENETKEGLAVIAVYSRSTTSRWTVSIGIPLDEVTAGLRQTLRLLSIATIAALIIGLALAWFIGGRIARSITAIGKSALALSAGQKLDIPCLHFKEAAELAQALLDTEATLQKSRYDAQHDALTGLANRTMFYLMVDQQLTLCRRDRTSLVILYIDLDAFKAVNDTHGHAIGDQLLHAVSVRIKEAIRDSDVAARLGGDEFAIALIHSNIENAETFAARLIEIISEPYQLGDVTATISASIGIAGFPASAVEIDTLLKQADKSMYKAKALGRRQFYTATLQG